MKTLFEAARALSPSERDNFLAAETMEAEVAAELRSLLAIYDESPDFLEGASPEFPAEPSERTPLAGRRLGPWVLVREIGEGGMGVVWEAHRADQEYEHRVAIKLVASGWLSASQVARFRGERQILARLDHPGIARLLDGGTAPDGSPYLVMEYVEGERLDRYVESRHLPLRDRLQLFLQVCSAVDYAHRRLVIHCDLKPANLLVTPEGVPKLLDFGIARLLEPDSTAPALTRTALRLTPEYASPEQMRGEPPTTASDVYSLGVLLYQLLANHRPHEEAHRDPVALLRAVCEQDPQPPSSVAGADGSRLRGELDAIVLQALRKHPDERYTSVRALAEDVSAWLEHRPVSAHRPSWARRWVLQVRRNKTQSAAAAIVLTSILAGSVLSLRYAHQAEIRFNQVRRLAHSVVFELHDAIQDIPGSTRAREILVQRALEYLRDLESTAPRSRDLGLEIAAAYARIGEVQGNLGRAHLGQTRAAVESETKARRRAQDVLRAYPGDAEAERILADADEDLVRLGEWQGDQRFVQDLLSEIVQLRRNDAARHPGDLGLAARALEAEADRLMFRQDWPASLAAYQRVVATYGEAAARRPGDRETTTRLAHSYHGLAACWKELNHLPEALASYRAAQRIDLGREAAEPSALKTQADLSFDLVEAGWIEHRLGHHRQAIADYEDSLAIQQRLAALDPQDIWMRLEAAKLLNTAAPAYEAAGLREKAITALKTSIAGLEQALGEDPSNEDTRLHVGWVWMNLGDTYIRAGQWVNAAPCFERAIRIFERMQSSGRLDLNLRPGAMLEWSRKQLDNCRRHLSSDH